MGYVGRCFAIKPVQAVTLIEIERLCLTLVNSFAPFILLDFLILLWLDGDALCCWSCVACAKPLAWTVRQASRSAARGCSPLPFLTTTAGSNTMRSLVFTSLWIFFSLLLVPFLAPCLGTPMTATNHWILCLVFALVLLVLHLVDQV